MRDEPAPPWDATLGVEEEFLIADPVRLEPLAAVPDILDTVAEQAVAAELKTELLASQVEAATGVCGTPTALRSQLAESRRALAEAAAVHGAVVLSTGFAPDSSDRAVHEVSAGERYRQVGDLYQAVATDYSACGCHVHVGVGDRGTAVAVVNHLRPWLPTLLALSANSPFANGRDTGYASWRAVTQCRFPGFGVPPWFRDLAAYEQALARRAELGITVDARMTFWVARPSEHVPTVEVRVADALATVDETVLQAGLVRALVVRAQMDLKAGREAPPGDPSVAEAAMWSAARYGLDGFGVDPFSERRVPADKLLDDLLAHVADALTETGDREEVLALAAAVRSEGTGARRQRIAAKSGGLRAAADLVTLRPGPDGGDGWSR
ncbi:carboxylate-amine ligase [Yinghuangia sp. YIM S09857]|uniref:carboxylate-amine ligase n=1 Tax=Yinghuangia sp. YIM S09857 TaxID=3436929 RepID=UPI003F52EACF